MSLSYSDFIHPNHVGIFIDAAREFNCHILVRKTGQASLSWVGKRGHTGKRADLKAKTDSVRAGMAEHSAQYRWSSYATNAQGIDNAIISLHELYLSLAKIPDGLQVAYRDLFESATHNDELELIRASLHSGTPLGNDRFKRQIAAAVEAKVGFSKLTRKSVSFSSQ